MTRIYCPLFLGQGGWLFSPGIWGPIAGKLRELGCSAEVFSYRDAQGAHARIDQFRMAKYAIAGVGYSLGTSTLTYLQRTVPFDRVLCIAMSALESAWPINHQMTRRSVLWHAPGVLSGAGENLGFDITQEVWVPRIPILGHLLMDVVPFVVNGVIDEVKALQ